MAKHASPAETDTWFGFAWGDVPTLPDNEVTVIHHDGTHSAGLAKTFDWSVKDGDKKIDYWHFGNVDW